MTTRRILSAKVGLGRSANLKTYSLPIRPSAFALVAMASLLCVPFARAVPLLESLTLDLDNGTFSFGRYRSEFVPLTHEAVEPGDTVSLTVQFAGGKHLRFQSGPNSTSFGEVTLGFLGPEVNPTFFGFQIDSYALLGFSGNLPGPSAGPGISGPDFGTFARIAGNARNLNATIVFDPVYDFIFHGFQVIYTVPTNFPIPIGPDAELFFFVGDNSSGPGIGVVTIGGGQSAPEPSTLLLLGGALAALALRRKRSSALSVST